MTQKRVIAWAVLIGSVALFAITLTGAVWYSPQNEISVQALVSEEPPVRLVIPKLDLDVQVQQAGLIAGNRMASPTNYTDVAWYKYGPAPGELGSAVIAGHLDNGLGLTGVFKDLNKLQPGDALTVETEDGDLLHFVVEQLVTYPYDQVPPSIFTSKDKARLNLITCAGKWIKTPDLGWTIDQRLIVYAVLRT
jgi:sortase A